MALVFHRSFSMEMGQTAMLKVSGGRITFDKTTTKGRKILVHAQFVKPKRDQKSTLVAEDQWKCQHIYTQKPWKNWGWLMEYVYYCDDALRKKAKKSAAHQSPATCSLPICHLKKMAVRSRSPVEQHLLLLHDRHSLIWVLVFFSLAMPLPSKCFQQNHNDVVRKARNDAKELKLAI